MTACRLVIPRAKKGSVPPSVGSTQLRAPDVLAIAFVYGVGEAGGAGKHAGFRPIYRLGFAELELARLDGDECYELDAGAWLATLQTRSQTRSWAVYLEFVLEQSARSVAAADLYVESPVAASGSEAGLWCPEMGGRVQADGTRRFQIRTPLAHTPNAVARLAGLYTFQLRDTAPEASSSVASPVRSVTLGLTEFEFE